MTKQPSARNRVRKTLEPKTHLVIPDSHIAPDDLNHRFIRLAKFICDLKPDKIINIGDMADMISLNNFDIGKTRSKFCGKSYAQDIAAAHDAMEKMERTILRTKWGKQKWKGVEKHITLGNHENRIERFIDYNGQLENFIDMSDLRYDEFGWKSHPYQEQINLNGVIYSHNVAFQMAHRPISGVHHAHTLMMKWHNSITVGHSHLMDYKQHTDISTGRKMHGLVAGCFLERDKTGDIVQFEDYAGQSQHLWWSGLIVKENVMNGDYDMRTIRMQTLVNDYPNV